MDYESKTFLQRKFEHINGLFRTDPPPLSSHRLMKMYSKSPWLRAVTNKVGQAVGTTDWRVFRPINSQGKDIIQRLNTSEYDATDRTQQIIRAINQNQVEEIMDHPLTAFLHRGNDQLSGLSSIKLTQIHIDLVGESFWIKERNGAGMPISYWPIPPHWIRDLPTAESPKYKILATRGGTPAEVPITEVVYFRDPDPADPYSRGTGIGGSLSDEIEIDEQASKFLRSFFHNRARPDLIVHGESFNREDAERVERKWKENHQGILNQMKPMFINRKVEIKELKQSFESMQLSTLRKQERDAILNTFGVPPEKLGVLSSCFDRESEILTQNGWVRFPEYIDAPEHCKVATWNMEKQAVEYQHPTGFTKDKYAGDLHHWASPVVDVMVTPNHRMLNSNRGKVSERTPDSWGLMKSEDYGNAPKSRQYIWRLSGGGYQSDLSMDTPVAVAADLAPTVELFAEFLGYFVSEGASKDLDGGYGVHLYQDEGPVAERMLTVFETFVGASINQHKTSRAHKKKGTVNHVDMNYYHKGLFTWLRANCGKNSYDMRVPPAVFTWPAEAQQVFLDAFMDGDGHWSARYEGRGCYKEAQACSVSKGLADDVQRIAIHLGIRCKIRYDQPNGKFKIHKLQFGANPDYCFTYNYQGVLERNDVPYDDYVYCVEVPNHTIITRRNGKVAIHGNSNRSTIDAADGFWQHDVLKPRVEFMRSVLQRQLVPDFGDNLLLHYQLPESKDVTLQGSLMRALPWAFLANDIRELAGAPSLGKAGDFMLVPSNSERIFVDAPSGSKGMIPSHRDQLLKRHVKQAMHSPEVQQRLAEYLRDRRQEALPPVRGD